MKTYIAQEWQDILRLNELNTFDDIWNCEKNKNFETHWVEEPNQRRGGWSGVVRIVLHDAKGQERAVFLKRQAKHMCVSLRHPFKGIPTFQREFRGIIRFQRHQIPTVTPVYYSERCKEAILMTEELTGYRSLQEWFEEWEQNGFPERVLLNRIINELARIVGRMHQNRYKHCCLRFKHIFMRLENNLVQISIIDLEKLRYWIFKRQCVLSDLDSLFKTRFNKISATDKWRFIQAYLGGNASKKEMKDFWNRLSFKLNKPRQPHKIKALWKGFLAKFSKNKMNSLPI